MKITKNYQLFIDGNLYDAYQKLGQASNVVKSLKILKEKEFTYEIIKEVNITKTLKTGTSETDFKTVKAAISKRKSSRKKQTKQVVTKKVKEIEENLTF